MEQRKILQLHLFKSKCSKKRKGPTIRKRSVKSLGRLALVHCNQCLPLSSSMITKLSVEIWFLVDTCLEGKHCQVNWNIPEFHAAGQSYFLKVNCKFSTKKWSNLILQYHEIHRLITVQHSIHQCFSLSIGEIYINNLSKMQEKQNPIKASFTNQHTVNQHEID